jgi:hypothetical protein
MVLCTTLMLLQLLGLSNTCMGPLQTQGGHPCTCSLCWSCQANTSADAKDLAHQPGVYSCDRLLTAYRNLRPQPFLPLPPLPESPLP